MMKGDNKNMQICTDIRENSALRRSFDALAQKTFGLTFEGWYQSGGWQADLRRACSRKTIRRCLCAGMRWRNGWLRRS